MNVIGHGVDLVLVDELRRWVDDPRDPFLPRCFTQEELDALAGDADRIERLAGRFAAKEAVLKALGTGFGAGVAFSDVIVRRAAGSPPEVSLVGGAAVAAAARGITGWILSISHAGGMAMASALALGDPAQAAGDDPAQPGGGR